MRRATRACSRAAAYDAEDESGRLDPRRPRASLIILDASAAIDYLVDGGERGEWVRERVVDESNVAAPHVIDLEVVSGLRQLLARDEVTLRQAANALADFV